MSDLFELLDYGVSMGARKLVNVVLSGLPGELQDIRNQNNLSLEYVCDPLKWQQSKLSRMENGIQCISDVDLGSLFVIYGVTGEERGHLLRMAERQDDPGYWETNSLATVESRTLKRLERATTAIVDVAAWLIPELAQTAEYAHAVMESDGVPSEHITARVDARLARQILVKDLAPKLDLIVGETALRRPMGSRDVMPRQLRALLEIAQRRDVRLRIVPLETGGNAGMHTAFTVMEFPRGRSVVYAHHPTSGLFLERYDMIDAYRRRVARLARVALEPAESRDLIEGIARDFELAGDMNDDAGVDSQGGTVRNPRGTVAVNFRRGGLRTMTPSLTEE
jgi:hypothetical protein